MKCAIFRIIIYILCMYLTSSTTTSAGTCIILFLPVVVITAHAEYSCHYSDKGLDADTLARGI